MAPSIMYHKGLLNGPGQNNCFLNSAVQVLWHLDIFRRSFRELSGHACMSESCIFCALKDLFGQLQFSHERALPPDALRKALAHSFSDQHRFQLGFMDDAAECFENILLRIHFHIAYNEAEDMCNAKHCIPHQKFAMTLVEQSVCGVCHATSEPLPFTQMVHYVSASALISQAKQINGPAHPDLFGQLLKKAGGMGDIRDCPSSCGAKIQIRRTLINRPEIVSVGIVWDSDRPSLEHIMSLLDTLRIHLRLSDVFHGSFDNQQNENYHQLVGVVTYYGKHYSTFFFHTKLRVWVYFDDANVREVGPHWEHVVEKCRRGRYQPLLLLFATPNGTPIDACNAPKTITMVDKPSMNLRNGHDMVGKPPIQRSSLSPTGGLAMGGRRSLTPSPEKPRANGDMTQRRAVTPNAELSPAATKPVLPNNDYQNLVQFQEAVFNRYNGCDNDSDQRQDIIEKYNQPVRKELVRRDSGNWSGDRNSASSSSSTSLENPYHYIIGKMHLRGYGGVPRSPNKTGDGSSGSGNSSGGPADPGYDSFSLSSTDSLPLQQTLKHNFQLAQIPEGHQTPIATNHLRDPYHDNDKHADDCERLCAEVDQLLNRSEHADDLLTALSLCNAAVNKARAAMDAPYSNPQTASFARMKHNACVMRARSLHRRLEEPLHNNLKYGEARHSREGSGCSGRGSTGSHSRQNSKDKTNSTHSHSRQSSQDLLDLTSTTQTKISPDTKSFGDKSSPNKSIEIYATLPKNKKGLLSRSSTKVKNVVEDEEYIMKERPGRSLLSNRTKTASKKEVEKRTRSEERNTKNAKELITVVKEPKEKDSKKAKQEEKQNKKQHKIRRKLLMGGLMRRKNRSMPDLREDESITKEPSETVAKEVSKDDSMLNSKTAIQSNLSGYLSEGNLEYSGNPNLERSKLMRKSLHGSKILQFSKVPPPPPLRTTSQLSKNDRPYSVVDQSSVQNQRPVEQQVYANHRSWCQEPASLPYLARPYDTDKPKTDAITYSNGGYMLHQNAVNTVVTEAQIHHEASFQSLPPSIDEPDFKTTNKIDDLFQLPPYPSPIGSTVHSRQASEDFPPPPATLPIPTEVRDESSFLSMLQEKREKLLASNKAEHEESNRTTGGEGWLKELQAKQAERRKVAEQNDPKPYSTGVQDNKNNVKDLKSRFEQLHVEDEPKVTPHYPSCLKDTLQNSSRRSPNFAKSDDPMGEDRNNFDNREPKRKSGKKKNVTFCEQVVLVATADDDEADNYIPNPILERVLRTVLHKESKDVENQERAVHSVVPLKRTDSWKLSQGLPLKPYHETDTVDGIDTQKEAVKGVQNSMKIASDVITKPPISRVANPPIDCSVDEVDSPSYGQPSGQSYNHENNRVLQNVRNSNSFNIPSNSYSPTYIPASSLYPPSTKSNDTYRNDYPEPISLQNEQPAHVSYNGYAGSDYYNDQNNDNYVSSHTRKFNDNSYPAPRDSVRYSPICNQDSQPAHNGYHSHNHDQSAYTHQNSVYQSAPSPSYQGQSYQPMSLQYYPSQNVRSSPQIHREPYQPNVKTSQYQNGHHSSSLTRQNSNVSHYTHNRQVSPQSPRRTVPSSSPQTTEHRMLNSSSRPVDNQRSAYSGHQFGQKHASSGVSPYQPIPSPNSSSSSYSEKSSASFNSSSYQNNSSSCDNLSRTSASGISPYQSVPHSSPHYPQNDAPAKTTYQANSPYQHVPYNSNSVTSSSNYYPSQSKPSPTHRNSLPPVYQHPPPPPGSSSNGSQNSNQNYQQSTVNSNCTQSTSSVNGYQHAQNYQLPPQNSPNTQIGSTNGYQHSNQNYQLPPQNSQSSQSSSSSNMYQHSSQNYQLPPQTSNTQSSVYQRVPTPNQQNRISVADYNMPNGMKYSPYQHPPPPKQQFDGKKGSPLNGTNVVPCNLCRKKQISPPSVYCSDCDFYISRFKQKT